MKQLKYLENLIDVYSRYMYIVKRRGLKSVKDQKINMKYKTFTFTDIKSGITYTNNELNSMGFTKLDWEILKRYFDNSRKAFNKFRADLIENTIRQSEANTSIEIDELIRPDLVLPAATTNFNSEKLKDKNGYSYHEESNIVQLDTNSEYLAALSEFGDIHLPGKVEIINSISEENRYFTVFRLAVKNIKRVDFTKFPLAQPSSEPTDSIEERGRFSTEVDTSVETVEVVFHIYKYDEQIINTFDYFKQVYSYESAEFVSGYRYKLLEKSINFNDKSFEKVKRLLVAIKRAGGKSTSNLYALLQHTLKTFVGNSAIRPDTGEEGLVYRFEGTDSKSFVLTSKTRKAKKFKNYILLTNILYTIINDHIRSWMNRVSYEDIVKATADAMFVKKAAFEANKHKFDLSDEIGAFKFVEADKIRSYNARSWVMFNNNEEVVAIANGGVPRKAKEKIKSLADWDDRFIIGEKFKSPSMSQIFRLKKYIGELASVNSLFDYSAYPLYNKDTEGKIALLADQGTGKTTSVLNSLFETKKNILHIFYNRDVVEEYNEKYQNNLFYTVRTLDAIVLNLFRTVKKRGQPNYELYRKNALLDLEKVKDYLSMYDTIVIDEFQSFYGSNRDVIVAMLDLHPNIIVVGDFNQIWKKEYREATPTQISDLKGFKHYTLNINYRNSQKVYSAGSAVIRSNCTTAETAPVGKVYTTLYRKDEEQAFRDHIVSLNHPGVVFMTRRKREVARWLKREYDIEAKSAGQMRSLSPKTVVLVNSTYMGVHEEGDPYDALKEIRSCMLRPRDNLFIIEWEGLN